MKWSILLFLIMPVLWAQALYGEIAILPYKIDQSSSDFPQSMGGEYSRLLSVATLLFKQDVDVTSPRESDLDLERMKLSPQDVITQEELDLLGKTVHIDYFLVGTLSHQGGVYRSESVLYSARERKIITRARVSDRDLFACAEKEIKEALLPFRDRPRTKQGGAGSAIDIVFLLDLSYGIHQDWQSVKNAVSGATAELVDTRRLDTRAYLIPFSDRASYASASVSVNSIISVREGLDKLKPAGGSGTDEFRKSLHYAVSNITWRHDARKMIIVISNSNINGGGTEKYGVIARNKGIVINTLSLGRVSGDQSEMLDRLAAITGGKSHHAAYHQKLYDTSGEAMDVYMENGRFFRSRLSDTAWQNGLYRTGGPRQQNGKPKPFLDELFYNDKKVHPTPYTMPDAFARITMERVLNEDKREDNIEAVIKKGLGKGPGRKQGAPPSAGKVLVSDGNISFWLTAPSPEFMAFFISRHRNGFVFPLGVIVQKDPGSAYGVSLVPVIKELGADFIPQSLKARLSDIVKRADYYTTRGLSHPPVWIVDVKVEQFEKSRADRDIRGK